MWPSPIYVQENLSELLANSVPLVVIEPSLEAFHQFPLGLTTGDKRLRESTEKRSLSELDSQMPPFRNKESFNSEPYKHGGSRMCGSSPDQVRSEQAVRNNCSSKEEEIADNRMELEEMEMEHPVEESMS